MDTLFSQENPTDPLYIRLRDGQGNYSAYRDFAEGLWRQFYPYADSTLLGEIAKTFQQRFWEMYLGCSLLNAGRR